MMMSRLVVDSVVTWAREYKVDGFRFDLMGHHPRANILEVRVAWTTSATAATSTCTARAGTSARWRTTPGSPRPPRSTWPAPASARSTTGCATRPAAAARSVTTRRCRASRPGSARGRRCRVHDRIKVGLAGGLATYRFVTHTGAEQSGAQIDYNGSPSGYAAAPGETVNYVDAHDNEILYDAMAFKLPADTLPVDRARMQVLALSLVVLGQGVGFVALGSERLRSKSLDRNSFNSGDWFNQIRWDGATGNGFGLGLPPAPDNEDKWPFARPLLADPALVPSRGRDRAGRRALPRAAADPPLVTGLRPAHRRGGAAAGDVPARRPVRGARRDRDVPGRHRSGPALAPTGGGLQRDRRGGVPDGAGVPADLRLHPELVASADPLLRTATAAAGRVTVPARSVAVYVADLH